MIRTSTHSPRAECFVAVACLMSNVACEAQLGGRGVVTTDSTGVQIVESRTPAWEDGQTWHVAPTPSLEIGTAEGDESSQLFRVRGVTRLSDGRIALINAGTHQIRIYSAQGGHIRTIGREGAGPGEFRFPRNLWITGKDSMIVGDLDRESVFDSAGQFVRARPYGMSAPRDRYSDGTLLRLVFAAGQNPMVMGQSRPRQAITRSSLDGSVVDTLAEVGGEDSYTVSFDGGGVSRFAVPFGVRRFLVLHDSMIYTGDGARFEVSVLDGSGNLIRQIRNSIQPRPVTPEAIARYERTMLETATSDEWRRRYERLFLEWTYPATQPAYDQLIVDQEGAIWMRHFQLESSETSAWTVFAADGRWLGKVELPAGLTLSEIGTNYVLGIWTDPLGVEYVRSYSLERR